MVEDVSYEVLMAIPKGKTFFGKIMVTFKLKEMPENDKPLFLDFYGRHIEDLQINGIKISQTNGSSSFKNGTVDLSQGNALKSGINSVSMYFINEYRTDGYGFHSFVDQVDSK